MYKVLIAVVAAIVMCAFANTVCADSSMAKELKPPLVTLGESCPRCVKQMRQPAKPVYSVLVPQQRDYWVYRNKWVARRYRLVPVAPPAPVEVWAVEKKGFWPARREWRYMRLK